MEVKQACCCCDDQKKGRNGFTIIELLITSLLLGILSTIVVNSFGQQTRQAREREAIQALITYAEMTKVRSLTDSKTCIMLVDHVEANLEISNPRECSGIGSSNLSEGIDRTDGWKICGTSNPLNYEMRCSNEVDGSDINNEGNPLLSTRVFFTPTGMVSQGALFKITKTLKQRGYCVAITSPAGIIRQGRIIENNCSFPE